MRLRIATSPWWAQALAYGLLFGAFMTAFFRYRSGAWVPAVVGGLLAGALYGVFMGRFASRANRHLLVGLDAFSTSDQHAVLRGSWRGPVPSDPEVREAARALLERRRETMVRTRRWSVWVFGVGSVLYVVLALTGSWLWWFCAAAFLVLLVLTLVSVPRMDRRLALLRHAGDARGQ